MHVCSIHVEFGIFFLESCCHSLVIFIVHQAQAWPFFCHVFRGIRSPCSMKPQRGSKSSIARKAFCPRKLEGWELWELEAIFMMVSLWFLWQRSQIISSMISPKSHKKPLQRLQRSLSAFHEAFLKNGTLSGFDTPRWSVIYGHLRDRNDHCHHAPRHPTWAQLSCKARALSYDFMAAALSYSRNLRFLMPTYALSSPYIGNVSRALLSTDWPAYGEPTWIHYGTLWPVSFLQQLRQLHLQRNHLSLAAARNGWHLPDKNHLNATPPVVQRALPASGLVFF